MKALERLSPISIKRWRSTHDLVKPEFILGRGTLGAIVIGHDARGWLDRCGVKPQQFPKSVYVAAADPIVLQRNLRVCQGFDVVITCQNENLEQYRKRVPKVIGSHLCAETSIFKPYLAELEEYDVGFIGTRRKVAKNGKLSQYYLQRGRWMSKLKTDGFKTLCRQGLYLEDYARMLCRCRIGFHHSNRGWWKKPGDYPPAMRVFEVMAIGRLLICDRFRLNGLKLVEGKHYVAFKARDYDEFKRKVAYYLEHDEERERIARAGMEWVRKNHTYSHRAALILRQFGLETRRRS